MPPAVFTRRGPRRPCRMISRTAAMGARFRVFPPSPISAPSSREATACSSVQILFIASSFYFAALAAMCTASQTEAKGGA